MMYVSFFFVKKKKKKKCVGHLFERMQTRKSLKKKIFIDVLLRTKGEKWLPSLSQYHSLIL